MAKFPPLTVFDLETTGLDPRRGHRIIEIAGVRIEDGRILEETTFAAFVNPERDIPSEAKQINKISESDVVGAPTIDVVLPQFFSFAQGSVLFAHNATFDASFLQVEKEYCWGDVDLPEILCTMQLSRNLFPHEFRHSLDVLARKFNLVFPAARHRALADAILAAQALQKMLEAGKVDSIEKRRELASLRPRVG